MSSKESYSRMQSKHYKAAAEKWSLDNRDPVVGSFDAHNQWKDYELFLFKGIPLGGRALDFGCGPGRCIVQYANLFNQIDGVDICPINLSNAKKWLEANSIIYNGTLYQSNGLDLREIGSSLYDVVFSTICLQHICVHEIRYNILTEFFRVLKTGGHLALQMGFGYDANSSKKTTPYFDNYYDAPSTNSDYDVRVEDPKQLEADLNAIGYSEFTYDIRPVGPGDSHPSWIFFRARK